MADENQTQPTEEQPAPKKSSHTGRNILLVCIFGLIFLLGSTTISFAVTYYLTSGLTLNPPTGAQLAQAGSVIVGPDCQAVTISRTTVYSKSEAGGINDAQGKPIHYLDRYLAGEYSDYVTLSSDLHTGNAHHYQYNTKAYIPVIEQSFAGGKAIEFRIRDTGGDFGGLSADRPESAGDNGYKFVDIPMKDDNQRTNPKLNLPNTQFPAVIMYTGDGCTREMAQNGIVQTDGGKLDVPLVKEKVSKTCNQVAIYMAALYYAKKYNKDSASIPYPSAPFGTCSTDGLLRDELAAAGFDSSQFSVHRPNHNLPQDHDKTWVTIMGILSAGNPVVIETKLYRENGVNQHWITITGISQDKATIYYNDPATGTAKSLSINDDHWGDGNSRAYIYASFP